MVNNPHASATPRAWVDFIHCHCCAAGYKSTPYLALMEKVRSRQISLADMPVCSIHMSLAQNPASGRVIHTAFHAVGYRRSPVKHLNRGRCRVGVISVRPSLWFPVESLLLAFSSAVLHCPSPSSSSPQGSYQVIASRRSREVESASPVPPCANSRQSFHSMDSMQ